MTTKHYFPGLAFLRFFAAISVVIAHSAGAFANVRPYTYERASLLEWFTLGGFRRSTCSSS